MEQAGLNQYFLPATEPRYCFEEDHTLFGAIRIFHSTCKVLGTYFYNMFTWNMVSFRM